MTSTLPAFCTCSSLINWNLFHHFLRLRLSCDLRLNLLLRFVDLRWIINVVLNPCAIFQSTISLRGQVVLVFLNNKFELLTDLYSDLFCLEASKSLIVDTLNLLLPWFICEIAENLNLACWLHLRIDGLKVESGNEHALFSEKSSIIPFEHIFLENLFCLDHKLIVLQS